MAIRENIIIILCLLILASSIYIIMYGCSYPTENFENGSSIKAKASKVSDDDAEIELENKTKNNKFNKRFDSVSKDKNDDDLESDNSEDEEDDNKNKKSKLKSKLKENMKQNKKNKKEDFKNKEKINNNSKSDEDDTKLSLKEKKLLDSFVKGELSDNEVEGLIESGAITEDLVEKFLQHLEIETFANPIPTKYGGMNIEPFCGNYYANYL